MRHGLPTLAISPGEPAGIGPDVCLQAHEALAAFCQPIFFGDPSLFAARAGQLGLALQFNDVADAAWNPQAFNMASVLLAEPVRTGTLDSRNSPYVLEVLERALGCCTAGEAAGLVTGPIHKGVINEAGVAFTGHTEWLRARTGAERAVMMLAAGEFRVALVTTHLPLREVADAVTPEAVRETIEVAAAALAGRFGIAKPRILVCGLNPHAGEGGHLGTEEGAVIQPVLDQLRAQGLDLIGPVSADTAFTPERLAGIDCVVAMYHDQGLPVLKASGFGEAVNITLGLPIVRTSVDHGTALELAGTGKARSDSLVAAARVAAAMVAP